MARRKSRPKYAVVKVYQRLPGEPYMGTAEHPDLCTRTSMETTKEAARRKVEHSAEQYGFVPDYMGFYQSYEGEEVPHEDEKRKLLMDTLWDDIDAFLYPEGGKDLPYERRDIDVRETVNLSYFYHSYDTVTGKSRLSPEDEDTLPEKLGECKAKYDKP